MSEFDEISEAEKTASERPALPGDVMDFGNGYRRLVRHATLTSRERWVGGDYYKTEHTYVVYIEAEEPVSVIQAGGGTCLVLPLEVSPWSWPPPEAQVWRNGVLVYDHGHPVSEPERELRP